MAKTCFAATHIIFVLGGCGGGRERGGCSVLVAKGQSWRFLAGTAWVRGKYALQGPTLFLRGGDGTKTRQALSEIGVRGGEKKTGCATRVVCGGTRNSR